MDITKFLESQPWLPHWLRARFAAKRTQARVTAEDLAADAAIERANSRRFVTAYSSRWVLAVFAEIASAREALQQGATLRALATRKGEKELERRFKSLRSAVRTLEQAVEEDRRHEAEFYALSAERDRWAQQGIPTLAGEANKQFHKRDADFGTARNGFEDIRTAELVRDRLRSLRKAVDQMKHIVEQSVELREGWQTAVKAFQELDRASVSNDPGSNQVYGETAALMEVVAAHNLRGDLDRGVVLLAKVTVNIDTLSQHSKDVCGHAADEVRLWRGVTAICPRVSLPFVDDLRQTPEKLTGDSYLKWISLRESIGSTVQRAATEVRSHNVAVLAVRELSYPWQDGSEESLRRFSAEALKAWQKSITD